MPSLVRTSQDKKPPLAWLQGAIDRKMCAIFWHIPSRGNYENAPLFYKAIKTPEDTLETLNDMRQISSSEFYNHRTIYVRGAMAAIAWHDWKPAQIQELMYAGTWFLMFKKELNSPNYTAQLKTLLNVIKSKVNPLVDQSSTELQSRWQFMKNYWDNQFVNKKITSVRKAQQSYSLA